MATECVRGEGALRRPKSSFRTAFPRLRVTFKGTMVLAALVMLGLTAGPSHAARVLVLGDSWAQFTNLVLEDILKGHGHADITAVRAPHRR